MNNGYNTSLQSDINNGTMGTMRKVQIFSQMVRHITALIYLIAELVIGTKPEKL
jgi:hypothetical protein